MFKLTQTETLSNLQTDASNRFSKKVSFMKSWKEWKKVSVFLHSKKISSFLLSIKNFVPP